MSSYETRSAYFELIATKNKLIAHNAAIEGSSNTRNAFFRINNEDELNAACANWIHFPCVVHAGHNIKFTQPGTGLPRRMYGSTLLFLAKAGNAGNLADNIEGAYGDAEDAMTQFLAYMLNDLDVNGACGNLFVFDLNRAQAEMVGPVNNTLYGWMLYIEDMNRAKDMAYDPEDWFEEEAP